MPVTIVVLQDFHFSFHKLKAAKNVNITYRINGYVHIDLKLNKANAQLFTIGNMLNRHILRSNLLLFDTCINYANLIRGQNLNSVRIVHLKMLTLHTGLMAMSILI